MLWGNAPRDATALCKPTRVLTIPVSKGTWQPRFHDATETVPGDEYGNDNRFVALALEGCLLKVNVQAEFRGKEDTDVAARLTEHEPDFGRDMWRVSRLSKPETIIGWASVEHPEYQADTASRPPGIIYALAMFRLEKANGGVAFGNLNNRHKAFTVLFVRRVVATGFREASSCYERLGVGRLFGPEVEADYGLANEETLWLI